jgi:hypothetical protein
MSAMKLTAEDIARWEAHVPTPEGIAFDAAIMDLIDRERAAAIARIEARRAAGEVFPCDIEHGVRPWEIPADEDFCKDVA